EVGQVDARAGGRTGICVDRRLDGGRPQRGVVRCPHWSPRRGAGRSNSSTKEGNRRPFGGAETEGVQCASMRGPWAWGTRRDRRIVSDGLGGRRRLLA